MTEDRRPVLCVRCGDEMTDPEQERKCWMSNFSLWCSPGARTEDRVPTHAPAIGLSSAGRHTLCMADGEPWPCRAMTEDRVPHPECIEAYHGELLRTGRTIMSVARVRADVAAAERARWAAAQPAPPLDVERLAALERLDRFVERVRAGWSVAGAIGFEDDQFMRDLVVIRAAFSSAPSTPEAPQ